MKTPCSIRDIQKALGATDIRVLTCCVLHDLKSDEYEAYAVVSYGGGREVEAGGRKVFLLNPSAPLSEYLRECRLGDTFLSYQVVSVDGSPILSETGRRFLGRERLRGEEARPGALR